jgi:prevent-host-death family protein
MRWRVAEAKEKFSEVLRAAGGEPQEILNRDRLVAVIVDPETFREFEAWRHRRKERTLGDAFAELRQLMRDEDYEFEIPPRRDRPNAFLEVLDELPG